MLKVLKHMAMRRQSDRYVLREMRRLATGGRHSVLGNVVKDEYATRQEAHDFFATLRRLGLKSTDRCVEIGCGSLWAAEPIIEYLQPKSYLGLDVTSLFFESGLQRLPQELLLEKRPTCSVITRTSIARATAFRPDLIFSRKTLIHVPPTELEAFLVQSCAMMAPTAICVHEMPPAKRGSRQINRYSWMYTLADLMEVIPAGFELDYRENVFVVRHARIANSCAEWSAAGSRSVSRSSMFESSR